MLAAVTLSLAAAPALATESKFTDAPEQRISVAGVDFRDARAVQNVYARLTSAASNMCRSGYQPGVAHAAREERACVRKAVEAVVVKANRPMLTAAHNARGPLFATGY
jgi:UrcA family protein